MKPLIYKLSDIRPPLTGVGRYSIELIRGVMPLRPVHVVKGRSLHTNESLLSLLSEYDDSQIPSKPRSNSSQNIVSRRLRSALGNVPYSRAIYRAMSNRSFLTASNPLRQKGGICHDLNYTLIGKDSFNAKLGNSISTVYDLSNITCPETHPKHRVSYLNHYFEYLKASANYIVTISETVRSELMEYLSIPAERIHTTHLAADKAFKPRNEPQCQTILDKYSLHYKKYLLCVGTLEPRKNLISILNAYEQLDRNTQQEFPLVLVGPSGWKSANLEKKVNALQEAGLVKRLGFVPQQDLPFLYSGANTFVYPSLYEGFGLPLLEAMQSGCPCITSDSGALSEVSSGNALEVNPRCAEDIANAIHQLLNNQELNAYHSTLGLTRAGDFTWAKTASKTNDIYDLL